MLNKKDKTYDVLPPTDGLPAMITVGELYGKIAKISQATACRFKTAYYPVFDKILMDWNVTDGEISCVYSEGTDLEQFTKPIVAEIMFKYDLTYRQALMYALHEKGHNQVEIAEWLGMNHRSGVSRSLRTVRMKMEEMEGWYDY